MKAPSSCARAARSRKTGSRPACHESIVMADANHFTIVEELIRPGSPVLTRIAELAREVDGG